MKRLSKPVSINWRIIPVEKIANPQTWLERHYGWVNYLFMGTSVVANCSSCCSKGLVIVEFGKIAKKLVERAPETEFDGG